MNKVAGVAFRPKGKIYYFDTGHFVLRPGDWVIVRTDQGMGLGQIMTSPRPQNMDLDKDLKPIFRMANQEDLEQHDRNLILERKAFEFCRGRIETRQMKMKLVKTEVLFDGSKIIFYYTANGRVDFRELVKDLVGEFRTRIEMRQIGVRHEAKMIGGLGCCGRELCCACFLKTFDPISVKMAKEQNLSLNPAKISGQCGRLMCCLTFEYDSYLEQRKTLPKLGKKINTRFGPGKVVRQNIMARTSTVALADGGEAEVGPDDILPNEPAPSKPHKKPDTEPEP